MLVDIKYVSDKSRLGDTNFYWYAWMLDIKPPPIEVDWWWSPVVARDRMSGIIVTQASEDLGQVRILWERID